MVLLRQFLISRNSGILILLLALLCVPWLRGIDEGEVRLFADEKRHVMNGLFLFDFMSDLPLSWPRQYAQEYYAKYPAVTIGFWPPAFYFIEALFFAIFGISIWAGRLAVIFFALLGAVFTYKIVRYYARPELAFASMVIYSCLPAILPYAKSTMLEIPSLAMSLGAIWCWLALLQTERPRYLYAVAFFSAGALLTKQTAIFLVPFFVFHFLLERRWVLLKWKHTYIALAGAGLLVTPWYALAMQLQPGSIRRALPIVGEPWVRLEHILSDYPMTLPDQLGVLLLVLSILGVGALVIGRKYSTLRFFLALIVACYFSLTFLREREPRYIIPWLLAFVFFAVYFVWWFFSRRPRLAVATLAGLAAFYYVPALSYQRPSVEGWEEAARYLSQQSDSTITFYQGNSFTNFIFFVRKFDPEKRRLVLREKVVVEVARAQNKRNQEEPLTSIEIEQAFLRLGIQYLVIENPDVAPKLRNPRFSPELATTHRALQSDQFELVREVPIRMNFREDLGLKLLIYRTKKPAQLELAEVAVPMLNFRYGIQLSFSRLAGQPWPPATGARTR